MKSYTDLEQSKKLAKILPLETADMFYNEEQDETHPKDIVDTKYPMIIREGQKYHLEEYGIPCWSLAALLDQLEDVICDEDGNEYELVIKKEGVQYDIYYLNIWGEQDNIELDRFYDDLIDCCYEMVIKLKEKDLI